MKSILQTDTDKCFLCGGSRGLEPLDKHHVFGGASRKASERYGLTVYLHHSKCHIFGKNSVHTNRGIRDELSAYAQRAAMKHYGWTKEEFIEKFGRSRV